MSTSSEYGSYFAKQNALSQFYRRKEQIPYQNTNVNPPYRPVVQACIKADPAPVVMQPTPLKITSPKYQSIAMQTPTIVSKKSMDLAVPQNMMDYNISKKQKIENEIKELMGQQEKNRELMELDKREKYIEAVKETIEKNKKIHEFDDRVRREKVILQNEYKSILDRQISHRNIKNEVEVSEQGRLTNAIERMEKAPNGMIPGIYNLASVGSKPIYRTGLMIAQGYGSVQHKTLEEHYTDTSNKYNPILNPIPLVTSNPYIIKEMMNKGHHE